LPPIPNKPKEYKAGALGVADLIKRLHLSDAIEIQVQNVAQINSKDMRVENWQALLSAVQAATHDPQTHAVLITHGTDTLEESAYFVGCHGPMAQTGGVHMRYVASQCARR
jgi:L-asparaginase